MLKAYFNGVGNILREKDFFHYRVTGIKDLALIVDHFDKYPLITQKQRDYLLFKQGFELVSRKEHLTKEGLHKIISIKASINKGLPSELNTYFPSIIPVQIPLVVYQKISNPYWLSGFVSGEGCF